MLPVQCLFEVGPQPTWRREMQLRIAHFGLQFYTMISSLTHVAFCSTQMHTHCEHSDYLLQQL